MMHLIYVEYGSPEYDETVQLRTAILRKPLGLSFTETQLAEEYKDIHLAVQDDMEGIIACLILTTKSEDTFKMRQVAVLEEKQGQGLGKFLVKFAEEVAKYNGAKKMELNARETAIPFYLSQQYTIEGQPFEEVGISHNYMYKML